MPAIVEGRVIASALAELAALYAARGNRRAQAVMARLARRPR